ncbi:alpha/beta hydrolase fold domain-containing protein [Modestobacter sp. URMC 112]
MPSPAGRLLPPLLRLLRFKRLFESPAATRARIDGLLVRPASFAPPRLLRRDVRVDVRHDTGWPVYEVSPRRGRPTGHVLYAHGGAWFGEITPVHWRVVAGLAAASGASFTVPIYPLAPLGTAGTVVPAVADLLAGLVERHGAGHVTAMGDSAGGQIALSAALLLRDRGVPPLRRTVLISPALDLSLSNPGIDLVEPLDPWLARPGTRVAIELWRAELPIDSPLVSPLSGDLTGLGPLQLFNGTRDITSPDTHLLVRRAREAGVEVELHEEPDLVHVYPLLPVPEGRRARRAIVAALCD